MKSFLTILFVICALIAAGWYFYDPYLKPYLEGEETLVIPTDDGLIDPGAKSRPALAAGAVPTAAPAKAVPSAPAVAKTAAPVAAPPAPKSELDLLLEEKYPMPTILPLMTIVDQWRQVPPKAYPAEVVASVPISFQLVVNGQSVGASTVAPGTPLKPLRLTGDQLSLASLVNPTMNAVLPVEQTDFKQRITKRYEDFVAAKTAEVNAKRAKARQVIAADPGRLAALKGGPLPTGPTDDPRFTPVKESLRRGEAASVTLEEAVSFHWNGNETVKGDFAGAYETVSVHFEVATIFGKFPVEYKALLRGGKVFGWIDPITQERI
jgi:hypothetical protein